MYRNHYTTVCYYFYCHAQWDHRLSTSLCNSQRCLYSLLPSITESGHYFRKMGHPYELPNLSYTVFDLSKKQWGSKPEACTAESEGWSCWGWEERAPSPPAIGSLGERCKLPQWGPPPRAFGVFYCSGNTYGISILPKSAPRPLFSVTSEGTALNQ